MNMYKDSYRINSIWPKCKLGRWILKTTQKKKGNDYWKGEECQYVL